MRRIGIQPNTYVSHQTFCLSNPTQNSPQAVFILDVIYGLRVAGYGLLRGIRHHAHLAGALDGGGDFALMVAAKPSLFAGLYFIKARHKTRQQFCIFVIHVVNIFLAEVAKHVFRILNLVFCSLN